MNLARVIIVLQNELIYLRRELGITFFVDEGSSDT